MLLAIVPQEQQQLEENGEQQQQQQQQGNGQAQGGGGKLDRQALLYCERFVEFLTDLLSQARTHLALILRGTAPSLLPGLGWRQPCAEEGLWPDALSFPPLLPSLLLQLPTRRFVHAVLEDRAILIKCYMSRLYSHPQGRLFVQVGVLVGSGLE